VVGQDAKYLGALIVPNVEALATWVDSQNLRLQLTDRADLETKLTTNPNLPALDLHSSQITDLFRAELNREVKNRPGYRPDDRIAVFRLILEPFSIENGILTQTLKIRRQVVLERYHTTIEEMYK
jgi:long-chain acyl-CoA synthetase